MDLTKRGTKSNCGDDEVEIELFDAGRLPSIEAEAPQCLAEAGRSDAY